MVKVVLVYTIFREVKLDHVDSTEIEQLQEEDQKKIEAAGFEVEDPTWELGDESDADPESMPSVQAPDGPQERPSPNP